MSQPSEWECPNYNLDAVDQINPEKEKSEYASVKGTKQG
jgi:hypothetical protein